MSTISQTTNALEIYDKESDILSKDYAQLHHNSIALDSLPYIDNVHPDYEAYALSLIEEEMHHISPRTDALDHLPNPFLRDKDGIPLFGGKSNLNQTEYSEFIARNGQPRQDTLDFDNNSIAAEPHGHAIQTQDGWETSLRQAKLEFEYQRSRMLNLELQAEYESGLWRHYNATLERQYAKPMSTRLEEQRLEVDKINGRRKELQETQAGPKLQILGNRWGELISKNQRLARATGVLEEEVLSLRSAAGTVAINGENETGSKREVDSDNDK